MSIPYLQHALDHKVFCIRHMIVMELFRKENRLWFHDIAKTTRFSKAVVSRGLDALGREGLVKRRRDDKNDMRKVAVIITDHGRKFLKGAIK